MLEPQPWDHPDAEEIGQRLAATDVHAHLEQAERTAAQVAQIFAAHHQALRAARIPRRLRNRLTLLYAEGVLCRMHDHGESGDETAVG